MSREIRYIITLEICLLSLIVFLTVDEHLENPTTLNLKDLVNLINKAVSIYLALMISNFIPANSARSS